MAVWYIVSTLKTVLKLSFSQTKTLSLTFKQSHYISSQYYSGRRMWGAYNLACPSCNYPAEYADLQSDPVYPIYTVPEHKLSQMDLFTYHRHTYQGTKYDLSAKHNLAGGPFSSPDRWKAGKGEAEVGGNWERAIGLYRTSDTYVVSSRSSTMNTTGAVLWFAPASPLGSVFTPFLVNLSDVPASFRSGHQAVFDRTSAFWAACVVANVANLKWSYAIKDVEKRQALLESTSVDMVQKMDEIMAETGNFDLVEETYVKNVNEIVTSLWKLSDEILFKYASGFVNEADKMSQMVGYPSWWLKAVGYSDGPPPPPTKPKCCRPKNGNEENNSGSTSSSTVSISTSQSSSLRGGTFIEEEEVMLDDTTVPLTGKAAMRNHLKVQRESQ